jgi:hypothetical protein
MIFVSARALPSLALALCALAAACAPTVDMMQPPPEALRGAAWVAEVELSLSAASRASTAAADAKLAQRAARAGAAGPVGPAALPFARMFVQAMKDAARERGLTAGRALRIVVEMDRVEIPGVGMAALGRGDRLAGQVKLVDARDGEMLATFYVDVDKVRPGLIGMMVRGTGVREKLALEFAHRVADQLTAHR